MGTCSIGYDWEDLRNIQKSAFALTCISSYHLLLLQSVPCCQQTKTQTRNDIQWSLFLRGDISPTISKTSLLWTFGPSSLRRFGFRRRSVPTTYYLNYWGYCVLPTLLSTPITYHPLCIVCYLPLTTYSVLLIIHDFKVLFINRNPNLSSTSLTFNVTS